MTEPNNSLNHAYPARYRIEIGEYDNDGWRSGYTLKVIRNDEFLWDAQDNGEPEDNLFLRDYSWVKPALEEAYRFGFEDGAAQDNVPEAVKSDSEV